jgi:hypothetical protein
MTEWWQASNEEVPHALSAIRQQLTAVAREMLQIAAEAAARGLAGEHGFVNDRTLLQCTQNISKAAARRLAAAADVLPGRDR